MVKGVDVVAPAPGFHGGPTCNVWCYTRTAGMVTVKVHELCRYNACLRWTGGWPGVSALAPKLRWLDRMYASKFVCTTAIVHASVYQQLPLGTA